MKRKLLVAALAMLVAQATSIGVVTAQSRSALKGQVLEVIDVQAYTYLRLKTADGEVWAAVNKAPVKTGAEVTIHDAMEMQDFESKALNRTFPSIMFGTLGDEAPALAAMPPGHPGIAAAMPRCPRCRRVTRACRARRLRCRQAIR